ncbi:AAA family ATPase [Pelosinus propionicus]|uniref:Wobble nucleotide-excising tRNase n=1 Tax=Pelosinus propionicus DSM 13327 TaxID=1123291 RepID=A0A1I4PM02_9FIRM|nr:AAA family ATPase [Pelosinus propionicus]SFM28768.1 Wobble nucleotide-excising tRNase [Pelosinus propionicus DSM 13327]
MIEKIEVRKVGSCFDDNGITLSDLRNVNFIYGANGSGKTTISKIISKPSSFSVCKVTWKNNTDLKSVVYNGNFINENFYQSTDIKGIFTLGKESHDAQKEIAFKKCEIDKISDEIIKLTQTLEQKKNESITNENEYEENCWKIKQKYDQSFQDAFSGFRNSKRSFKEKCKQESKNTEQLFTYDELKTQSNVIFGSIKEKISTLRKINYEDLNKIESDPILCAKIIGSEDVDISGLIKRLNNSDWVKQGYEYYKLSDGICPFCQQQTGEDLRTQLEEYFNDTYNQQTEKVKILIQGYLAFVDSALLQIASILSNGNQFLDSTMIEQQERLIEAKYQTNRTRLDGKIKELSNCIKLDSLINEFNIIHETINSANKKIVDHNNLIDNIAQRKKILISQIWRFVATENSINYKRYLEKHNSYEKAIIGINGTLQTKYTAQKRINGEIQEIESKITSIVPTITEINKILTSFGFLSFKLIEANERGYYKIIRDNGENAKDTLSEGEKTFITFLYFYHLLKGSNDADTITTDKIVVFDDPISSLDSSVLFIVSNLIRGLIDDVRAAKGYIKQVFILTHNIYFHKEVSFCKNRSGTNKLCDETFWILRKKGSISQIESYESNPIKTSYELLWQELKYHTERNAITIQNTMRRIIENYFKILGHLGDDDLINKFDSEERVICRSLMSWINDGSHFVNDDLYVDSSPDTIAKYLKVFEKIFELTENAGHYKMMMGNIDLKLPTV